MKRRWQLMWRGLTLVEVVCALVLLSVTATSLLTAQARSLHQLRTVSDQHHAAILAHELITQWRLDRAQLTKDDQGRFEEAPEWSWRRVVTPRDDTELMELHLIIERRPPNESRRVIAEYAWLEAGDDS